MKLALPNVTCVQIEALNPDRAARVLDWCASQCDFADVVLLSPRPTSFGFHGRWVQIPKFGYVGYSTFSTKCLAHYIETDFALVTQHDGFILHPELWRPEFLKYDYIGAPWPAEMGLANRVGNSGFSLRSRKFLRACADAPVEHNNEADTPEAKRYGLGVDAAADDIWMCQNLDVLAWMKMQGVRYAPVSVAKYFSSELPIGEVPHDDSQVFGFHDLSFDHRQAYKALVGWTENVRPEPTPAKVEAPMCPSCERAQKTNVQSKWGK